MNIQFVPSVNVYVATDTDATPCVAHIGNVINAVVTAEGRRLSSHTRSPPAGPKELRRWKVRGQKDRFQKG